MMMSELMQIRRIVSGGYNTSMKVVNAIPGMANPMTEEERKDFLANGKNKLLARIEFIDEKGEPNIIPAGCYLDGEPNAKHKRKNAKMQRPVYEELEGDFI
jgi:hypothetical protein